MTLPAWPEAAAYVGGMWLVIRPLGVYWGRRADARRVLDAAHRVRLTRAFEALGPERVARGVTARGHSWRDCFIALAAFDGPAARDRARGRRWWIRGARVYSSRLELPPTVISDVATAWDRHEAAVRALAQTWLEQRPTPSRRAVRVLAGERR